MRSDTSRGMPQLAEVNVAASVVAMDEMSWSTVGGHKIGAWFASLGSRGRGRRKAAAVAAAVAANNTTNNGVVSNNNTTRSFTLGKTLPGESDVITSIFVSSTEEYVGPSCRLNIDRRSFALLYNDVTKSYRVYFPFQ